MKRIISFVLAFAMCFSLSACGGNETPAPSQAKDETITVHAQVPADWTDPGCWVWSDAEGKDAFEAWPGEKMALSGEWYTIVVPSWIDSVIINGNDGTVQTADLPVESGRDLWVVVNDSDHASVFYEEPTNNSGIGAGSNEISSKSLEEVFSTVGTLNADQITEKKALPYVYRFEDHKELSRKIDLSLLPEELTAASPEEVRYLVHFKYCAVKASFYMGNLLVYNTYITAEIQDVLSGDVLAEKSFQGAELPESITSNTSKYYAEYPDEAEIIEWIYQQIQTINVAVDKAEAAEKEARMAEALSLAQRIIASGCFSYSGLIEALMDEEVSGFAYEEAVYAADNCGADWFEEAAESALRYVGWGIEEKEMLIQMLEEDGFTHEQAVYGAENSGI